ncbi:MAG: hypothetical protein DMD76_15195, partial [Candidatus Rokuibacteriota bacterium]
PGLIFIVAIYTFPYVYIMVANTLALIASDLEEAAAILGAGRLTVARTVTLPMVLPALASGFILAVLQALALFGSPAILALPAGFHTVTTQIWSLFQFPPKVEQAAAFSIPLLLATALLLQVQKRVLGRRGYAAVGGKGGQRRTIPLGVWRFPALFACLAVMACAIFLPYGVLAKAAFARAWAQPLSRDNLTLGNFTFTFFEYGATRDAIVNTLELGVMTACVGAVMVAVLSYVTNRRLVVGHQLVAFLALAPVVVPGVVLAVGLFIAYTRPPFVLYGTLWILFLAYLTKEMPVGYAQADATFRAIPADLEDAGRVLGAGRLRILKEVTAPLAKSGIIAAWCFIFIGVIYTFPYVYIMVANTLALIASDLEEAAAILGAGRLTVARTVTLPMVLPALASGFILAVLQALALFGSPAILALPAGFHTVTTQIWSLFQFPPKVEQAAAFSIPLLLATALLLQVQKRVLGRRGYAAVGGKGGQRRTIPLGVWRFPALFACLAVMACAIFLPYGVLAKAAFARAWAQPLSRDNLTLGNFTFTFFEYGATRDAIVNTLELGVMTACVGAVMVAVLSYVTNRRLVVGHQLVAFLALAPVVVPGVVLAVGLFIAYTRPPFVLYGTLWILFLAYLTKEMPVGYAQADATFRAIPADLEDAGRVLGAGRLRILKEVTAPLAKSGIIAAWCFIFIGVIRELSASILLFTPSTKVMSVVIFDLKEEGQFGAISVLGLVMLGLTFATVALVQAALGRDVLGTRK